MDLRKLYAAGHTRFAMTDGRVWTIRDNVTLGDGRTMFRMAPETLQSANDYELGIWYYPSGVSNVDDLVRADPYVDDSMAPHVMAPMADEKPRAWTPRLVRYDLTPGDRVSFGFFDTARYMGRPAATRAVDRVTIDRDGVVSVRLDCDTEHGPEFVRRADGSYESDGLPGNVLMEPEPC